MLRCFSVSFAAAAITLLTVGCSSEPASTTAPVVPAGGSAKGALPAGDSSVKSPATPGAALNNPGVSETGKQYIKEHAGGK